MSHRKYIWMLLVSVLCLGMTLYVLLVNDAGADFSHISDPLMPADSTSSAWVILKDSLPEMN